MKPLKKSTFALVALLAVCCCSVGLRTPNASADAAEAEPKRYYDDYSAAAPASTGSETFTYSRVVEERITFPNAVPYYSYDSSLPNACGPIAGAIIVGYYDKYVETLMPNFTAYYTATGNYKFGDSTHIPALINDLYTRMRTNVDDVGVSEYDCVNGLNAYVYAQGESISYVPVKVNSFDETAYKTAMNDGRPVLMFCNSISIYGLTVETSQTEIYHIQTGSSHIAVGYGYRKLTYYNANNVNFRTDTYLEVATGWSTNMFGYVKLSDTSWLDSAYAIEIY